MRCALLGITHFSKGTSGRDPTERITGSLAFGALASGFMLACAVAKRGGLEGAAVAGEIEPMAKPSAWFSQ